MATGAAPPYYSTQSQGAAVQPVMFVQGGAQGLPQGVAPVMMVQGQMPNYDYKPSDYLVLSVVIAIIFGIFSPLTVFLTIPAIALSLMSRNSAKRGNITLARNQGLGAAYLSVAAVISSLAVGLVLTAFVIPFGSAALYNDY